MYGVDTAQRPFVLVWYEPEGYDGPMPDQ